MSNPAWRMAQSATNAALKDAEEFQRENPEAQAFQLVPIIRAYRKTPKGFSRQPQQTVRLFLESALYLGQTNESILENLRHKWSPYPVPAGFLDKPLPPSKLKSINNLLLQFGKPLNLREYNSLSKIKLALRARFEVDESRRVYNPEIAFAESYVIVGRNAFH